MASNSSYIILPLHWGSRDIILADWIALFTLGLAPLIAHIVSGAPRPSYLSHDRPKWHDRLCTYNPASIVWRYAAITDRRIRNPHWGIHDIAASNAMFWTARGWDGTESMVVRCQPYAIRLPHKPTVDIFSMEMLKTIIALAQGVQAMACIIGNFHSTGNYTTMDTVSGLFIPIAICGLMRLCAAFWLTDDFIFMVGNAHTEHFSSPTQSDKHVHRCSVDSLQIDYDEASVPTTYTCYDSRSRGSIAFRTLIMIPFLGCWCITFLYITPWMEMHGRMGVWTTTSWLLGLYYMTLITPMTIIMGYYCVRGSLTTTIIPCISTWWYKAFSVMMAVFTVVLIGIAAIETHRTVCGKYSSLASEYGSPCLNGDFETFHLGPGASDGFGVAQGLHDDGQFTVVNFLGQCIGLPMPAGHVRNATML